MTSVPVAVRGPIAVIPSPKAIAQLGQRPDELLQELRDLSAGGVLPGRLEPQDRRLLLYTRRSVASLYLTKRADAYRLGSVSRRSFRDEERLLAGALLVRCPGGWRSYQDVRDLGDPGGGLLQPARSAHWPELCRAWDSLGALAQAVPAAPDRHTAFLDLLTGVVEAGRDIEIGQKSNARPMPYRSHRATGEQRFSGRGVYTFELTRRADLQKGDLVYVEEQPALRGRVERNTGRELTVRFEGALDYRTIPPQGAFRPLPSTRVYRAQLDAVESVRAGRVANPAVPAALIDRRFAAYPLDRAARPRRSLDARQLEAFHRALAVPDLLLVLGPPGTGKTTTIVETAVAAAARGERVLITSHTNRAVDNVLEHLPPDLRAVRVGNEGSMTSAARALLVDTQVDAVRQGILATTEAVAEQLSGFGRDRDVIDRWAAQLTSRVADARAAEDRAVATDGALAAATRRAHEPIRAGLDAARTEADRCRTVVQRLDRDLAAARDRTAGAQARAAARGAFAFAHRWWAGRAERRAGELRAARSAAQAEAGGADARAAELLAQAATLVAGDPEAARLTAERDRFREERDGALADAARAAEVIRGSLRRFTAVPPAPADLAGHERFAQWAGGSIAMLVRRSALLAEWRARIATADVPLQRELVRYADVVAATCIGTATSLHLAGLDFDLAIVDEAGQISTPNLLVPLVRARRGVLVGDHRQLPPFLDDDVRRWADGLARTSDLPEPVVRQIGELLRQSGFERLYPAAGRDNGVMLSVQRRMPRVLADFVSAAFYDGLLGTEHRGGAADPVFRSPFAMVDTADRLPQERYEERLSGGEAWQQHGYRNAAEAELIAELVHRGAGAYPTWAVIVPYKAQVALVVDRLGALLGDAGPVADNVGTVDSFQGGERDLVVFGFTRSNDRGEVGFLTELRRLNVAITRARQQLVLVGDSTTLGAATDRGFAALIRSLNTHLARHGDVRRSADVLSLLRATAGQRP
ncbi:AAA domain-containing protein [Dactylosporangium sp. AC04546]|uniref:DEAD/DEAH box helicase n=1 Tax=Dactylosporangium sp. AC04546 TaxID=2862460 RepID=UPI001EDEDCA8|nr:AAA domain-containing protein [Dactylosporangium sp. AC04546]WVK82567.1 AAA domain-containing protein [Dactylosporangium sp. AC04546]